VKSARKLHAVPAAPKEPPIDVTALLRADIAKRDWTGVHVAADRRPFLAWPDTPKRIWRA